MTTTETQYLSAVRSLETQFGAGYTSMSAPARDAIVEDAVSMMIEENLTSAQAASELARRINPAPLNEYARVLLIKPVSH